MFDGVRALLELLLQFGKFFLPWCIVEQWESGVILRFGKFKRPAPPGFRLRWPLGVETLYTVDTYPRPARLPAQSLTTADGAEVVVSAVVTHRVANAKRVLLECGNAEEALIDSLTGVLAEHVTGASWADLTTREFWDTVRSDAQRKAKTWGIKILTVQPADVARCPSLRLFGSQPTPPAA